MPVLILLNALLSSVNFCVYNVIVYFIKKSYLPSSYKFEYNLMEILLYACGILIGNWYRITIQVCHADPMTLGS